MLTLYPDQQADIAALRDAFTRNRHVLFQAPTGYGKTVLGCTIANGVAQRKTRTCFVVHRKELIDQTCAAFNTASIPYGVISPDFKPNPRAPIQIASVFTLARRSGYEFDLLIIDECHHVAAGAWQSVIDRFPLARTLGLTATPCRLDGQGLGNVFQAMIQAHTMRWLIEHGRLSPYDYWCPDTVDLSGLRSRGADYSRELLERAMRSRQITGCCISHYKRICDGLPFIAFCVSVDHAKRVAEDFRGAGYPVEAIDGTLSRDERRRIVQSLGRQNVGITSCDLVSEGFDVPAVVAAILLRPTKSLGLYLQQVGRALRVCPGKQKAVILDCVGNVLKHGLPDAEREWCLTRGVVRPEREADADDVDIRHCPACYAVHEWAAACPYCGHVYVAAPREVKQVAGELRQLTPEEIQVLEEHARRSGKLKDWHDVAKATGRKPGWAFCKWKTQKAGWKLKGARVG